MGRETVRALSTPAALSALCLFVSSTFPGHAAAQDVVPDQSRESESIEEIVVTGSRIKRRDFSSPSPITTIDRQAIEFSGQPTLEETLNQMPQVIPDYNRTYNNPGNGTSRINLRGMGAGRTLVLLNARRLAPSGVGSAVDVNSLPQALVERVEIITGGATTVYGSDAVAGVVNFITRDDFTGFGIEGSAYSTAESDSEIYDINLAYGHELGGGRGNITVYAGAYEREALLMSERSFSQFFIENDPATGELFNSGSGVTPSGVIFVPQADFGNGPAWTTFNANGIPREFIEPGDRYNFAPVNYLQTPLTRVSGGLFANYEFNRGYELYVESAFSRNEATQQLAEVPAFAFAQVNTDNPVLTPEARQHFIDNYEVAPGMAVIGVGRRLSEVGPRIIETEREYWRTVVGLRGDLGNDWEFDGWVTYTISDESEFYVNDASASRFTQGLLVDPVTGQCFDPSNGCVPLDIFGEGRLSPEAAQFLRITNVENQTERTQTLASVFVTGSPLDSWAGPIDVAIGLEWRSDDATFKADDVLFTGDTLGFAGDATVEGKENVAEIYGEAIVPLASEAFLAESLMLEVGLRYSDYDNAGSVDTYKVGGEWRPVTGFALRGMHQKSVRAPNNQELFQENFTESSAFSNNTGDNDPCSASQDPVGAGNTQKCILQGLPADQVGVFQASPVPTNFIGGGNPTLVPEESETLTFGAVFTPDALPNWSLSIDYYDIEVTDSIGPIDAMDLCFDPNNTENLFCENIRRDPDPNGAAGNIVEIFEPQSNRGILSTRGIDTLLNYGTDLPGGSTVTVDLVWTHTLEYKWQQAKFSDVADCAGFFGEFCDIGVGDFVGWTIPENRATANANYIVGPLTVHLTWRWIEGTTNTLKKDAEFFGQPEPLVAIPEIGSKSYFDLGVGYAFTDNIRARLGASNIFDTDPPMMADGGIAANTDPGLYDVFGRSFYLAVSMNFLQ
jgi:outer membrane receptor protein involved in Fe transport